MFNFKIVCDKGYTTVIRAMTRSTAVRMFCLAEGCSEEWFCEHCKVRKVLYTKTKFKLTDMRSNRDAIN
jgi:hypothetical protein